MTQDTQLFPHWGQSLLILLLAGTFFYLDLLLPLGFAAGIPYISLVLIGLWSESRKLILANSLLGTVLTVLGAFYSPVYPDLIPAVFNRLISIGTLWLVTYFCLMSLKWAEEKNRGDLLEKANQRLREESGYVQLHRDISSLVNLSHSLDDAIKGSLKKICEFTKWPVGHLYLLSEDGKTLSPSGIWYLKNKKKFKDFWNITERCSLSPGEGLPGRVLLKGKTQFITDIQSDPNFPRASMEKEIEVVSGFGFPILVGDDAVGVMEFYSAQPMKPGKRMLEVMESIGLLLGRAVERTRADEDRKKYNDHLRRLYHKLDSIREEESKRIARDIHDELGQVLTTLKMELTLLSGKIPMKQPQVQESVGLMFDLIEKNIQVVNKISRELRPPVLDTLCLTDAIHWQGKCFQDKTGIQLKVSKSPEKIVVDEKISTTLFRIFQECLTNISRHSQATEVAVEIIEQDRVLIMQVRDNGKGIAEEDIENHRSLGILGMKERVHMLGGEVHFLGEKQQGTTVTITIKL